MTNSNKISRMTFDSKSMLARLLANENIIVEHMHDADTASFDTVSRRLVLPMWNNMDGDMYDMLVGHEVGHALFTPGGIDVVDRAIAAIDPNNPGTVKMYLNIVEDARIERLMKRRYPGLAHNFRRAYTTMYQTDMFGFKRSITDPATLVLIDRLNLRAKVGVHADVDIPLSIDEQILFEEMMRTDGFDDVVELTRRIYNYRKPPVEQPPPPPEDGKGGESGVGDDMMNDDPGSSGNGTPQPNDNGAGAGGTEPQPDNTETPAEPVTSNAHRRPPSKHDSEIVYVDLPVDMNIDSVINDRVLRDFHGITLNLRGYDEFRAESNRYVTMLCKEFELRKAADIHARTSTSRSGVIDTDRLHQYRISDDIFRRMATVREGKNHGMVMFIDWSSSMRGCIDATIRQVMCLAWFCRRTNIPFEVYGFSDCSLLDRSERNNPTGNTVALHNLTLHRLVSSNMNTTDFTRSMNIMYHMATSGVDNAPRGYTLHGTPLYQTVVAARYIVDRFRERNNLQIVNTVILTDGDDGDGLHTATTNARWYRAVVRDMQTRAQVEMQEGVNEQHRFGALLNLLRFTTGSNVIGFYLVNSGGGKNALSHVSGVNRDTPEFDTLLAEFRNKRYAEVAVPGYDAFFIVPSDKLEMKLNDKDDFINKNLTKGRIAGAFLKASQAKQANRVLIGRFIGWISR